MKTFKFVKNGQEYTYYDPIIAINDANGSVIAMYSGKEFCGFIN